MIIFKRRAHRHWLRGGISALSAIMDASYEVHTETSILPVVDVVEMAKFRDDLQKELDNE